MFSSVEVVSTVSLMPVTVDLKVVSERNVTGLGPEA